MHRGWQVTRFGRLPEGHHVQFSAERLFVKLESLFAISQEQQIRSYFHKSPHVKSCDSAAFGEPNTASFFILTIRRRSRRRSAAVPCRWPPLAAAAGLPGRATNPRRTRKI